MTSYEPVYDQQPPSMVSYVLGISKVHALYNPLHNRDVTIHTLEEKLAIAQNHMK